MNNKSLSITGFETMRDGNIIRGKQYRGGAGRLPIAVLSHGFMANQSMMADYARFFARHCFAAFTFDFCGGCVKGKSDGDTREMSVLTEMQDLKAVIAYAASLPDTDEEDVTLIGASQGGFVTALTAAELQERIRRIILLYPALCIPDDARAGKMMFARFDPDHIPEKIRCGPMKLGRHYPMDVIGMDPFREIASYKGPVLILQGTKDKVVNVSYAMRARAAYQGTSKKPRPDVVLHLLEAAGHCFKKAENRNAFFVMEQFLAGRSEVLSVDVRLTGHMVQRRKLGVFTLTLPFIGSADSPWFSGRIEPGAVDVQQWKGGKPLHCEAAYTITGWDWADAPCSVNVVNRKDGDGRWKPTLSTDSAALVFLNGADCYANLEQRKTGPLVRIFAKVNTEEEV